MALRTRLARYPSTTSKYFSTVLIALLLGACSGNNNSPSSTSTPSGSGEPVADSPGDVPVISAPVVQPDDTEYTPPANVANVYETLSAMGMFTRLLALSEKVGLDDDLKTDNPITVFAPTDEAFAALEEVIGVGVLDTIPVAELSDRLGYHAVLDFALDSTSLREYDDQALNMSNDLPAVIGINSNGDLMINSATITTSDVAASNGIIQVIDTVLTAPVRVLDPNDSIPPPSQNEIATTLLGNADYSTLLNLIESAGLTMLLQQDNDGQGWTLFAPSDEAFRRSGADVYDADAQEASDIVQRHLYSGRLPSHELVNGELKMSQGSVEVSVTEDGIIVGGARIVGRDRVVGNGIIHYVDRPLSASEQ